MLSCWQRVAGRTILTVLPKAAQPPVRPVKGQMLALQMEEGIVLQKVIRAPRAKYPADVYLVPKNDGRLVIGATSEEMGFDTRLTAGGLFELLRGTWEAVPGIYDLPVLETWTGLRPGSRDNAPILGETGIEKSHHGDRTLPQRHPAHPHHRPVRSLHSS